jgi:hypothetical protein
MLNDFFKSFFKEKKYSYIIDEENSSKTKPGTHLTIACLDRDVVFFHIHDSLKEGEQAFELLVKGHWCGFQKEDTYVFIFLFDYYGDKLVKEKEVVYKNISKRKIFKRIN